MANLSRSYSKRSYNGHGFTATETTTKSQYDDVFGGPPKLGVPSLSPRLEDYAEIFGGFHSSRTSSIPILDLPLVVGDDDDNGGFDYSDVFGGFKVVDFALSYEDLVRQSSAGYNSSDEAWSPAQSESLSDDSDPSAFSERSQRFPCTDEQYSVNDVEKFDVSDHRPNRSSDVDDPEETIDVTEGVCFDRSDIEEKECKRSDSHSIKSGFGICRSDQEPAKPFFGVADISLRTKPSQLPPPSRPPPGLGHNTSKSSACEVDASSSAELIKDAMAKAQEKLRSAKESMEKKKQDLKMCEQLMQSNATVGIEESKTVKKKNEIELDLSGGGRCNSIAGESSETEEAEGDSRGACENEVDQDPFELDLNFGESHRQEPISRLSNNSEYDIGCDRFDNETNVVDDDAQKVNWKEQEIVNKEEYEGEHKASAGEIANENIVNHGFELREEHEHFEEKEKSGEQEALETYTNSIEIRESLWEEDFEKKIEKDACNREFFVTIRDAFKWDCETEESGVGPSDACEEKRSGVRIMKFQEQEQDEGRSATTSEEGEVDNVSEEADELDDIDWIIKDHCRLQELSEQVKNDEAIEMDEEKNIETVQVRKMSEHLEKISEETEVAFSLDDNGKTKAEHEDGERESDVGLNNLATFSDKQENFQPNDVLTNSQESSIGIGKIHDKKESSASQMACDSENLKATNLERQKGYFGGLQFNRNKEVTKEKFSRQVTGDWSKSGRKIGEALSAVLEDGETPSQTDQRSTNKRFARDEITSTKDRIFRELKAERMAEEEQEDECLKKIEEEREREREREKDRMAMSRDALEKAYAVGQKATVENRGRFEKPFVEAREKSFVDKASTEARLRAERAAVERATAEARQRAFEKAMAEKAANDARERVERSYSDRFSGSVESRTRSFSSNLMDQQNPQQSKLRYSYSSANAGIEGESPQRCKARIERYQRTAERAAKALAEKNMRDLIAQREQAERSRVAEALDGEVKRWSNGKEGNLRALLSTLQYILGSDSGWQPVPLTEVITSAAVKRAYRKATLCVHPDKVQQRGASIQQKYICEKVFDLLKEAWNKFNSEEW